MPLTAPQLELLERFRFNYPDDLDIAQQALDTSTASRDTLLVTDGTYAAAQVQLMADQAAFLLAKKNTLDASDVDPDHAYAVHYGAAHPSNGGTNPADWDVRYTFHDNIPPVPPPDPDPGPPYAHDAVAYSHAVAWDSAPLLVNAEAGWTGYQTGRFHAIWGTNVRAARITAGLANLQAKVDIVTGRESAALAFIAAGHPVARRRKWDTTKMAVTRQTLVAIRSLDGSTTYVAGVDYNLLVDQPTAGQRIVTAKNPNVLPALVMLVGP